MKKTLMISILLCLSACAPLMVWDKEGATQQDYNKDSYECEKDARQSGYFGNGLSGTINMQNFFARCMTAYGWYRRAATDTVSGSTAPVANPVERKEYQQKLKKAEEYCKKTLKNKAMGSPEYNGCIALQIDNGE